MSNISIHSAFKCVSAGIVAFAIYVRLRKRKCQPKVTLFGGRPPLYGQSKWLGGALSQNGKIYCSPGDSPHVLEIDPKTLSIRLFGGPFKGKNKWLRGVRGRDGCIYCLPACANKVLRISPDGSRAEEIGPDFGDLKWKWHGGVESAFNGCIYAVPCNSKRVLVIDPSAKDDENIVTLVGPELNGRTKFYGCLEGSDGAIYGIPQNAGRVLRIDPKGCNRVTLVGPNLGEGGNKWHGGVSTSDKTAIFCIPNHACRVLKIDCVHQKVFPVGPTLAGKDFGWNNGKYKYLGGVCGYNDAIYFMPGFAEKVLKVTPSMVDEANEGGVEVIGPSLTDRQNKWQNGYYSANGDHAVYGIPVQAQRILRISKDDEVSCVEGAPETRDAYEGGVESNGELYCVPMRARCVMKLTPRRHFFG
eukprot:g12.t1